MQNFPASHHNALYTDFGGIATAFPISFYCIFAPDDLQWSDKTFAQLFAKILNILEQKYRKEI